MKLILSLQVGPGASASSAPGTRILEGSGISIGRGSRNDWILPDPNQPPSISREHCRIDFQAGNYVIRDTSLNGVFINDAHDRLPENQPIILNDGDEIKLGNLGLYSIGVRIEQARSPAQPPGKDADPLFEDEFFGAPRTAPQPAAMRGSPAANPAAPGVNPFTTVPPPAFEHDDFFDLSPSPPPSIASPVAAAPPPLPDLDEDFFAPRKTEWVGASEPDNVPAISQAFVPSNFIPEDWDLDEEPLASPGFGGSAGPAAAFSARTPEAQPFVAPQERGRPQSFDERPVANNDQALLQAFLTAAGLAPDDPVGSDPTALMQKAGSLFRLLVEGMRETLMGRKLTKSGFRLEQTVIGARQNNPLKFSPDVESALIDLLRPTGKGEMPAEQAVAEGFKDLKNLNFVMVAGTKMALQALLSRFDPKNLENRLDKSSVLSGLVPGARRAKYWEIFLTEFNTIARDAEDQFSEILSAEIARAYEEISRQS